MKHVRLVEGFTEQLMAVREKLVIEEQADKNLHKKTIHIPAEPFDRQWIKALRKERKKQKYLTRIGMPDKKAVVNRGVSMHTGEYTQREDGKWILKK
jgi:hypothetical protein